LYTEEINMSSDEKQLGDSPVARTPQTLSLKDLITIISVCIALAMAWGVFGTRITILENDMVTMKAAVSSNNAALGELSKMVERVRAHQLQHDIFIDQIYDMMKKSPPRRFDAGDAAADRRPR
jgi:hypothetical protein